MPRLLGAAVLSVSVFFIVCGIVGASGVIGNTATSISVIFDGYACGQTHTFTDDTGQSVIGSTTACPPSLIRDEGTQRLGGSPAYLTNTDKWAAYQIGGSYPTFMGLSQPIMRYASGAQVWDGSDVSYSKSFARSHGWLLHNAAGAEISYGSGGSGLLVNPGNADFQTNEIAELQLFLNAQPWVDGIYFDNFMMDMRDFPGVDYPIYNQSGVLLFSNPDQYQTAQISFISQVGAALKSMGKRVSVNAKGLIPGDNRSNDATLTNLWMDRYAPYVTSMGAEYWQQRSTDHSVFLTGGDQWYHQWDSWQTVQTHARADGIEFWPLDYISNSELPQCRYLRASYLLEWDGHGNTMYTPWTLTQDIWNTCTAFNPGLPTGAKTQLQAGVWRRDFASGYVIINTTAASVTIGGVVIASGDAVLHQN